MSESLCDCSPTCTIPYGYCHCGCGQKTPLADRTATALKWKRGFPIRFVKGHYIRLANPKPPNQIDDILARYKLKDCGYDTLCWIWTQYIDKKGYGKVKLEGTTVFVHRLFYEQEFGSVDVSHTEKQLHHLCRVKSCCNPRHMVLIDTITHCKLHNPKGLPKKKVNRGTHPLRIPDDVRRQVRELYAQPNETLSTVAKYFNISGSSVHRIVKTDPQMAQKESYPT